jgi:hypothetical protein
MTKLEALKELLGIREDLVGQTLHFGKFVYNLPVSTEDAKQFVHSLGASGMEAYIEQALSTDKKDPNLFKNAALELHFGMKKAEEYLKKNVGDPKLVDTYMGELEDTLHWLSQKLWRKQLAWDFNKKEWTRVGY